MEDLSGQQGRIRARAIDGILSVFPNEADGRDPLELTVHVLSNEGFQIRAEKQRRPPMTDEEKAVKRQYRIVVYMHRPPGGDDENLRPDVHAYRLK